MVQYVARWTGTTGTLARRTSACVMESFVERYQDIFGTSTMHKNYSENPYLDSLWA